MNSPILPTIQTGAPDALYDDIEHALLALTEVSLDDDALPGPCVDEFDIDFLVGTSPPPCRRRRR
jgi:hypothetical protein